MNDSIAVNSLQGFIEPAIVIAIVAVMLQAVLGIIGTVLQMRASSVSRESSELNLLLATFAIIDSLPNTAGRRIALKRKASQEIIRQRVPSAIREVIEGDGQPD